MNNWSKKRSIANRYNITSQGYDEQYTQEQTAKYTVTQKLLKTSQNDVILDVGCGSGLFFPYVANKVKMTVGVDISHKLLLKAKNHAKSLDNVHIVQADADYLPFKNAMFNVVFAFTMLQNMPTPKKTLFEFKRQITSEGNLVVTGLKKAFELHIFLNLFKANTLRLSEFIDTPALNCYIVIASR